MMAQNRMPALGSLLVALVPFASASVITNRNLVIDMVQNNPGDSVAWQQTKYFDPRELKKLNYTGQTTTGEMSGTQAVDFHTLGSDFFPAGSAERLWLDAYKRGVHAFVDRAAASQVDCYFFVDLLVFPASVLKVWTNATDAKSGKILWNDAGKELTRVLVRETVAEFPAVAGWIVRTGETYVFDLPFHTGNSPAASGNNTQDLWVDFISLLRDELCEKAGKQLLMRTWDSWPSEADWYLNMSNRLEPHDLMYFSIKHTPWDFVRPSAWNPMLGVGKHAQLVEIELQREYEGKMAYPNYMIDGVIDGFPEMNPKVGISSLVGKPQFKGYWTWTRGGGWWGPYLHGNEWGVDLHAHALARWWNNGKPGLVSEPAAFEQSCEALFEGCTAANGCCKAMRNVTAGGALSVLHGAWGTIHQPGMWMRDDRICGLSCTKGHFDAICAISKKESNTTSSGLWSESLAERAFGASNFLAIAEMWRIAAAPHFTDFIQRDKIDASVEFGVHLYAVMDAAWRAMAQGYLLQVTKKQGCGKHATFDQSALEAAVADYDSAWRAYRAFGLGNVFSPSLYHDYYFCLGTNCDGSLDPKDPGDHKTGIGAFVDTLRKPTEELFLL